MSPVHMILQAFWHWLNKVLADLACVQRIFQDCAIVLEQGAKSDPNLSLQIAVILVGKRLAGDKLTCNKQLQNTINMPMLSMDGYI